MDVADVGEGAFGGENTRRGSGLEDVDVGRRAVDLRSESNVVALAVGAAREIPTGGVADRERCKGGTEDVTDGEDVDGLVGRAGGRHARLVRAAGGEADEGETRDEANTH